MAGCVNALRCLVFTFNFLFWLCGVVTLGLGIWLLFDPSASDFFALHSAHEASYQVVAWLLIAAGIIITFIGCFGCCGAWKLSQCALLLFIVVLVIVFCLQIAAAYIAYNKQDHIKQYVETSMYDTMRNRYVHDEKHRTAFDYVQKSFQCCGVKSYLDWLQVSWEKGTGPAQEQDEKEETHRLEHGIGAIGGRGNGYGRVPQSCCNELGFQNYPIKCGEGFTTHQLQTFAEFVHNDGCAKAVNDWVYSSLDLIIAVCVITAIIELLAIALSTILCCCVNKEEKEGYARY